MTAGSGQAAGALHSRIIANRIAAENSTRINLFCIALFDAEFKLSVLESSV
jgi:hypothetical protein